MGEAPDSAVVLASVDSVLFVFYGEERFVPIGLLPLGNRYASEKGQDFDGKKKRRILASGAGLRVY